MERDYIHARAALGACLITHGTVRETRATDERSVLLCDRPSLSLSLAPEVYYYIVAAVYIPFVCLYIRICVCMQRVACFLRSLYVVGFILMGMLIAF